MSYELIFSTNFTKSIKKLAKNPDFLIDLQTALNLIKENPYNSKLKTHKLKGKLKGLYASSIDFNFRLIFDIIHSESSDTILFVDVGVHDDVY